MKPLRYEIGTNKHAAQPDAIIEVDYDCDEPPAPDSIAYLNSRDEENDLRYGPYLKTKDDIDQKYSEPRPDPAGAGFNRNLLDQLERKKKFTTVEVDNPDSWDLPTNRRIYAIMTVHDKKIVAKNPMCLIRMHGEEALFLLDHPAVVGAIIEKDCGTPTEMNTWRARAGKVKLPCWFVFFGKNLVAATACAREIEKNNFANMGVTLSPNGEYTSSEDILRPNGEEKMRTAELDQFAANVITTMKRRGMKIRTAPGECNHGHVEGCDVLGKKIPRRKDKWDDVCFMIQFDGAVPFIAGIWQATTRPGWYYDRDHVLPDARDKGAAIIETGQQFCWQRGLHRGKYIALVQTGGACTIVRDADEDLERTSADERTTGFYGINCHHGNDFSTSSIGPESAGCNVIRRVADHNERMGLVDKDPGQQANKAMVWGNAIIPYEWLEETGVPSRAPVVPATRRDGFFAVVPGGYFSDKPFDLSVGPVSVRMNNPGAVNGAKWEESYPGFVTTRETTPGNKTTVFQAPEYGIAVWWDLMRRYRGLGSTTVGQIVNRYGGGQDYSAYVATVCKWSGLSASKEVKIDGSDDATLLTFAKAMFRYECGLSKIPWSDAQIEFGFKFGREFSSTGKPLTGPMKEPTKAPEVAAGTGAVVAGGAATGAAASHSVSMWAIVAVVAASLILVAAIVAAVRVWREKKELGDVTVGGRL